jgi:hypothetical protein
LALFGCGVVDLHWNRARGRLNFIEECEVAQTCCFFLPCRPERFHALVLVFWMRVLKLGELLRHRRNRRWFWDITALRNLVEITTNLL